jgi:predicted DCC family thiol-disulfide oxidoreductase YuxK
MLIQHNMTSSVASAPDAGPILFYDGVCGLCDRTVQFVLRHDRDGRFRFAALQSARAHRILARHGRDPSRLDTMYLLVNPGGPTERLLDRSDGIVRVLEQLGGVWRLSAAARVVPRFVRDRAYDLVARNRYRWFGRYDRCVLPPPNMRARFLDDGEPDETAQQQSVESEQETPGGSTTSHGRIRRGARDPEARWSAER